MDTNDPDTGATARKGYVHFLSTCLTEQQRAAQTLQIAELQGQVDRLHELMRSPRHRVADSMANLLQRIPIIWPVVARITDSVMRRRARRGQ